MSERDHLSAARDVTAFSEDLAASPDARSVPYLLAGILDALVAIAERLPAPTHRPDRDQTESEAEHGVEKDRADMARAWEEGVRRAAGIIGRTPSRDLLEGNPYTRLTPPAATEEERCLSNRLTPEVIAGLRRDNEEAKLKGWRAEVGVDDLDLLLDAVSEPREDGKHEVWCDGTRGCGMDGCADA